MPTGAHCESHGLQSLGLLSVWCLANLSPCVDPLRILNWEDVYFLIAKSRLSKEWFRFHIGTGTRSATRSNGRSTSGCPDTWLCSSGYFWWKIYHDSGIYSESLIFLWNLYIYIYIMGIHSESTPKMGQFFWGALFGKSKDTMPWKIGVKWYRETKRYRTTVTTGCFSGLVRLFW